MPRVPGYQPNQIGPVQTTNARLRAADNNGGAFGGLAEGMQGFGENVARYAQAEDQRQALFDETQARSVALEFKAAADPIVSQYGNQLGQNAVAAGATTQDQIKALRDETLGKATNPRMRRMLDSLITPASTGYIGAIGEHASRQQLVMTRETTVAEINTAKNSAAASFTDPAKLAHFRSEAEAANARLGALEGWSPAKLADENFKAGSDIHSSVISQALATDDVTMAHLYFEAHKDEMGVADRNSALQALKGPLEHRQAEADFAAAAMGTAAPTMPGPGVDVPAGTYAMPVAGRVSGTHAQHQARGSNGLDIAAAVGSAIHPIAGGQVIQVGQDDRSGRFVIVKHPDGHTSSYSHLGNQSVKVGDAVHAGSVIGTVGMTGRTTGPHVHLRTKDSAGRDVDPQKLIGGTAAGGTVVGSPQAPRNWDIGAIIANIDKNTDWSPERRERAKEYARQRMGQDESALADQRQDADEAASAFVVSKREGFTDTNQIPRAVWNSLSPADQIKWQGVAEANRKPRDPPANGSDVMALNIMRFQDPERFQKLNLGEYQGKMTRGELDTMLTEQARMRSDAQKPEGIWSPRSGIVTAVSYGQSVGGIKLDDGEKAAVMNIMEAEARRLYEAKGKKALTDDEYAGLFRSATRNVSTQRQIFGRTISTSETPRYKLTEGMVPSAARTRIEAAFKREMGRDPSDEEVLRLYQIEKRN